MENIQYVYVFWGIIGVVVLSLTNILEAIKLPIAQRPELKRWVYWIPYPIYCVLICVIICLLQSTSQEIYKITEISSFYIGITAPSFVRGFAAMISSKVKQ